ncbi:MAG: tetratricopeptide repeat protein [Muribaculaceae bacterium]
MIKRLLLILCCAIAASCFASTHTNQGEQENFLGKELSALGLYDAALKHHLDALAFFEHNGMRENVIRTKNYIFRVYLETRRLKEGEEILLEALDEVGVSDTLMRMSILNNLGIVYAATSRHDKAIETYSESLRLASTHINARATTLINIADLYFRQSDYKTARNYLYRGLELPADSVTTECRMQMMLNIALIDVASGDVGAARTIIKKVEPDMAKLPRAFAMNAFAQTADVYLNLGDSLAALRNILKYEVIRDSIQANIDNTQLQTLLITYDTERLRARNENLSLAVSRRNVIIWSTSSVAIIAFVLIVTLMLKRRNEKRANAIIHRQEQQLLVLERERAENERRAQQLIIDEKDRRLMSLSIDHAAENKLRSKIVLSLNDVVHALPVRGAETARKLLLNLRSELRSHNESATSDDFKVYFEQVHPTFFNRLDKLHPQLTLIDKRLCAFLYLGLSTKEIAAITCKEIRSVETSRLRLRKKLGLEAGSDISHYLHTIQDGE